MPLPSAAPEHPARSERSALAGNSSSSQLSFPVRAIRPNSLRTLRNTWYRIWGAGHCFLARCAPSALIGSAEYDRGLLSRQLLDRSDQLSAEPGRSTSVD